MIIEELDGLSERVVGFETVGEVSGEPPPFPTLDREAANFWLAGPR